MNVLLFGESRHVIGRYFHSVATPPDAAILTFDAGWNDLVVPAADALAKMSVQEIAELASVDPVTFPEMIAATLRTWRISPSRSFINVIRNADRATPGASMFGSILEQSRILASGAEIDALPNTRGGYIRKLVGSDKKPVMVAHDGHALTATEEGATAINRLARAIHVWGKRNAARIAVGDVKAPKALFRGVRSKHIRTPAAQRPEDTTYAQRACRRTAEQVTQLSEMAFGEIAESPILSFTATETIADYFTMDEGFVVRLDPTEVEVIASWSTDDALSGKDHVNGRHEREWIVRVPRDLSVRAEDIRIHDRTWHVAMGLPEGIRTLHHHTVASYELDGRRVRARFVYNPSGIGGALRYTVDDGWSMSRMATRKAMGFDPLPDGDRLQSVRNLVYTEEDFGRRSEHLRLEPTDFLEPPTPSPAP